MNQALDALLPDPKLNVVIEANSDGTISDGEKEQADKVIVEVGDHVKTTIRKAAIKLHKLGGPFRSPAYFKRLMDTVTAKVAEAVQDEQAEVGKERKAPKDGRPAGGKSDKPDTKT